METFTINLVIGFMILKISRELRLQNFMWMGE